MNRAQLKQELQELSPEGKIPCAKAFELAEKYNISRLNMGEILDELKIKITKCQLGCF